MGDRVNHRNVELLIVFAGCLAPIFLMAYEISSDEFFKSAAGIALAGTPLVAYRLWQGRS